ncbi:uncharacterized protein, partial [Saccopteryx bilineata]|uniref:uncharacterized protein n=1 Tax=Saccopteryx bilineata TaxID=59482 RepID=UPI00338DA1C2
MSSPSHTPNPSPTQSPSQSRTNQQPNTNSGGSAPSPSPTRGSSSRPTSHPPTPNASQPSSRTSSLAASPHAQPRGATQPPPQNPTTAPNSTPPTSKSPSQSVVKSISRNSSQTPPVALTKSPSYSPAASASYIGSIPAYIAPYVPHFLKEPPFFQPPTSPLPLCRAPVWEPERERERPLPPESLYLPLLPPPPHYPRVSCSYRTPPALFTPPCSLTYTPPTAVLVSARPPAAPTVLPATFYTPFSRYYSQPQAYRPPPRRRPSGYPLSSQFDSTSRSVHFFS